MSRPKNGFFVWRHRSISIAIYDLPCFPMPNRDVTPSAGRKSCISQCSLGGGVAVLNSYRVNSLVWNGLGLRQSIDSHIVTISSIGSGSLPSSSTTFRARPSSIAVRRFPRTPADRSTPAMLVSVWLRL